MQRLVEQLVVTEFVGGDAARDFLQHRLVGRIADGAKHITFEARASRPVTVKFGGSGTVPGDGAGVTEFNENVTTSWQTFTMDGPTNIGDYNSAQTTTSPGAWNGFSIVGIPDNMSGVYILVRNVRWTP